MSTQRSHSATMSTKMSGQLKNSMTAAQANSTSVPQPLPCRLMTYWSQEVVHHQRRTPDCTLLWRTKSRTSAQWTNLGMLTLSPCAKGMSSCWVDSLVSKGLAQSRNTSSRRISGRKWQSWRTRDTILVRVQWMTSSSMRLEGSLAAQSRRSMTLSKSTTSRRIPGWSWLFEWK